MMVIGQRSWLRMLLVVRGTPLQRIWRRLVAVALLSIFITAWYELMGEFTLHLTVVPFTLIGLALSIFLGFRNNTSYERFWEGRKLWGSVVNVSRNMARQVHLYVEPPSTMDAAARATIAEVAAVRRELVYRIIAYVHLFRHLLRNERDWSEAEPLVSGDELERAKARLNPPLTLLEAQSAQLQQLWRDGWINAYHLPTLERSLVDLTDIQGACERIKSTPIPASYNILMHRLVAVYVFALPFGLVKTIGWLTPLVCVFIANAFLGLDAIGDEIEQPFGKDPNDLPLSAISRMIEINLRQTLGDTEVPPMLKPVNEILS
jgi:ion channel-forming bestrophin family protein